MTVYGGPWVVSYPVYDPSLWLTRKTFEKSVGREFAKTEVWKLIAGQPGCAHAQVVTKAVIENWARNLSHETRISTRFLTDVPQLPCQSERAQSNCVV